ncbi:MAG: sporulation protein [Clostridiales bacterium]|nr:sporulation protein [Clostridiales bacterium]
MDQNNLTQNVNSLFTNLEDFTQKDGVLGKPITHGNKTFIPVVSVTLGYGSGSPGMNKSQQSSPTSGGAIGMGAKLNTEAVIVVDKEEVSMLPIDKTGSTKQLVDKIPQMVMNWQGKQGQQNQNQQNKQNQQMSQNQGQ